MLFSLKNGLAMLALVALSPAVSFAEYATIDKPELKIKHDEPVKFAAISPDGSRILSISGHEYLKVWDAATGLYITGLDHQFTDNILWATFSPDAKQILFFSDESQLTVWDIERGNWFLLLAGHQGRILSGEFSPDGNYIVSTASDNTIKLWDAKTGELLSHTHVANGVGNAIFSPDGQSVISASLYPHNLQIWELNGRLRETRSFFNYDNTDVIVAPIVREPDYVLPPSIPAHDAGAVDAKCHGHPDELIAPIVTVPPPIPVIPDDYYYGEFLPSLSKNGRFLAVENLLSSWAYTIAIFDSTELDKDKNTVVILNNSPVYSAEFSPNERYLVTASEDGVAKVWNSETGELVLELRGHTAKVSHASFSNNGGYVVTASEDGTVRLWDVAYLQ